MKYGCRFQAIDLRWGVRKEASLDQQTVKICLEEIYRCQEVTPRPNFIILLGDRYGWRPLPYEIPAEEFENIERRISDKGDKNLLNQWYRRDDNAVNPVYCLLPRSGEYEESSEWEIIEHRLKNILQNATAGMNFTDDQCLKYTASATEQEIVAGALRSPDASEHAFCFFRTINKLPQNKIAKDFIDLDNKWNPDIEARSKLNDLKERLNRLLPKNKFTYEVKWSENSVKNDHIDKLCEDVYHSLSGKILEEIAQLEEVDPLEEEIAVHNSFGKNGAKFFIGRTEILQTIAEYIKGKCQHLLAIFGESGSGKTALVAKAIEECLENHLGAEIIYRFIGTTPNSSDERLLIESLCRQITRSYGDDETTVPTDYKELIQEFPKCLGLATAEKPLILFLDALDQLSGTDNAKKLIWLPPEIPDNVRIIVSSSKKESLSILKKKSPKANLNELGPLPLNEGSLLLTHWLKDVGRTLQDHQLKEILDKFRDCGLPLYLKLSFEEARRWKSYTDRTNLSRDIPGLIKNFFARLSSDANHGEIIVSRSLGYLAAAKNGLSEDEMLDVLSLDKEVFHDFSQRAHYEPPEQKIPIVIWSRLYFDLKPYLTERAADGASLMTFYHPQLREVVKQEFLVGEAKRQRHEGLAQYFNSLPLWIEKDYKKSPHLRKVIEQPWQQAQAKMGQAFKQTLTDFEFMLAKNLAVGFAELIQDYNLIIPKPKTLRMVQQALFLSGYALTKEPHQMPGQLMSRLRECHDPNIQAMLDKADTWREFSWLLPITQSLTTFDGPLAGILKGHTDSVVSLAASRTGSLIATVSSDNTIKIWELETGEEANSIFLPKTGGAVAMTPDGKLIASVAANRQCGDNDFGIKIWNGGKRRIGQNTRRAYRNNPCFNDNTGWPQFIISLQ